MIITLLYFSSFVIGKRLKVLIPSTVGVDKSEQWVLPDNFVLLA